MQRLSLLFLSIFAFLLCACGALAHGNAPVTRSLAEEVERTLIWMVIGGALFFLAFKFVDWTTPGDLKKQLAEGNTALAIYAGALCIAAAIIIAALIS